MTRKQIAEFLDDVAATVAPVGIDFQWRPQLGDPDDEMVLEAAINCGGSIVTHNARDFRDVPARFGLTLLSPQKPCEGSPHESARLAELSPPLKKAVEDFAAKDGVSVNQYIALAVAEKIGARGAAEFFAERGETVIERGRLRFWRGGRSEDLILDRAAFLRRKTSETWLPATSEVLRGPELTELHGVCSRVCSRKPGSTLVRRGAKSKTLN